MRYRTIAVAIALLGGVACADRDRASTEPGIRLAFQNSQNELLDSLPEMLDSLGPVRVATPEHPLPPPLSDADLAAAVARAGGKVMVGLKPAASRRTQETGVIPGISRATALGARSAISALGAVVTRSYRYIPAVAAIITPDLAPRIRTLPMVDYVEPLFAGRLQSDDPTFGIGGQDTTWGVKRVRAPDVWSGVYGASTRGEGIYVTILDGGIDETHRWSGDGPANLNLDCYYYVESSCYSSLPDTQQIGHGVHVAGILASTNDGLGGIGVAWNLAGLASIKVCTWSAFYHMVICPPDVVYAGLDWAIAQSGSRPRQIVNMSLGWCTDYVSIRNVLSVASLHGILVVASAGNYIQGESEIMACPNQTNSLGADWPTGVLYPARYSSYPWNVMAVAGTLQDDSFALAGRLSVPGGGGMPQDTALTGNQTGSPAYCYGWGSRYGAQVQIAAPIWAWSMWTGGTYHAACGTSMSAPFVAGVAALVWSHNPSWTADQVRGQLVSTAVPVYGAPGSFGRVDAVNAVYSQLPPPPPPPPPSVSVSITGPTPVPAYTYCTWTAGAYGGVEPYSFSWTVDGSAVGDGSNTLGITTPGSDFSITVVVTDANGLIGSDMVSVSVGGASTCNIQ